MQTRSAPGSDNRKPQPLATVDRVATETDGHWARGFHLWNAVHGTDHDLGPAFGLLVAVWPDSGWMERRQFRPLRLLANREASRRLRGMSI